LREPTLVLCTNSRNTGGNNFAALRDVALQKESVFIVDLWSVIALKWIGLTTAENGLVAIGYGPFLI
jgi:hypothetical protein